MAVGADLDQMVHARAAATRAIVDSAAEKKLVAAGPGTGKTVTFKEAFQACGERGLALTFIRNLVADLKDALNDVADVFTSHGFCKHQMHRHAVEGLQEGWDYYPPLLELLTADLQLLGRSRLRKDEVERCLHNLDDREGVITDMLALGNYYNAVSHTDLVYRVLRHFEQNEDNKIPEYPLIAVDEYQDFSLLETSFIALLSSKSPVLIAGDDDQALYAFKNASARYIRELAHDDDYATFELPYCSRCPSIIVDAVKDAIEAAVQNGNLQGRIEKEFRCYLPEKQADSDAHPRIIHARCSVERNNAPYIGKYVTRQIAEIPVDDVRESHQKGYPTVLVIGPNPFLKRAYDQVKEVFPQAVLKTATKPVVDALDGYRRLAADEDSRLGWRIIVHCDPFEDADAVLGSVLEQEHELAERLPDDFRERHLELTSLVRRLIDHESLDGDAEAEVCRAVGKSIEEIKEALAIAEDEAEEKPEEEVDPNEPTIVCTSLVGAKGLSGGYVYIVGFNDGHFPRDPEAITDEDVCCFVVGLSRTRKECHLVSCRRFGNQRLQPSRFGRWIRDRVDNVAVDAEYLRSRGNAART